MLTDKELDANIASDNHAFAKLIEFIKGQDRFHTSYDDNEEMAFEAMPTDGPDGATLDDLVEEAEQALRNKPTTSSWIPVEEAQLASGLSYWCAISPENSWYFGKVQSGNYNPIDGGIVCDWLQEVIPLTAITHVQPYIKPAPPVSQEQKGAVTNG